MFQLSLYRDRIEAIPYGFRTSHHSKLAFSPKEFLEDRRNRKHACPGFPKTAQEREIFELSNNKGSNLLGVKPLVQRTTNVGVVGWK
jgi:hypothetical protein